MKTFRIFFWVLVSMGFAFGQLEAQVHVGIFQGGMVNQIGIGTDIDKKYFGELRFVAADLTYYQTGAEAMLHRNFAQTEWYNLHAGLMLGMFRFERVKVGIPLGLSFKPIAAHRNFSLLMEGMPYIFPSSGNFYLRANIGLRYTFRKD